MSAPKHTLAGIIPPVPTFFTESGEIDTQTLKKHVNHVISFRLGGILALGSNGEAPLLNKAERVAVIKTVRAALDACGSSIPLLAGTGAQTVRDTAENCAIAADLGASFALILPPFAFPTYMTAAALRKYYETIATASPIPALIYNMPANAAGIDISSQLALQLAEHPNIIGMKDSSGQLVKMMEIISGAEEQFIMLAGSAGFLLPALAIGAKGAIAAAANVIPGYLVRFFEKWQTVMNSTSLDAPAEMILQELRNDQNKILPLNRAVTSRFGPAGLKAALRAVFGYTDSPREPLLRLNDTEYAEILTILQNVEGIK